jgi:hypothetical protein
LIAVVLQNHSPEALTIMREETLAADASAEAEAH